LVLAWVPVYGLAILGDAIVFNSIEFWTGNNPIVSSQVPVTSTKRIARKDAEAVLTHVSSAEGEQLIIEQFQHGQPAGTLRLERQGELTMATDAEGRLLYTAQTFADGRVVVRDAQGRQVASYAPEQVQRLAQSVRQ
jgi:hypothetical protein